MEASKVLLSRSYLVCLFVFHHILSSKDLVDIVWHGAVIPWMPGITLMSVYRQRYHVCSPHYQDHNNGFDTFLIYRRRNHQHLWVYLVSVYTMV